MSFIVRFSINEADCDAVLGAFAPNFLNSSIFRGTDNIWHYQAFCQTKPAPSLIESLYMLAMLANGRISEQGDIAEKFIYHIEALPPKDWLAENIKNMQPMKLSNFYIIPGGGQINAADYRKNFTVKIAGSLAFGTGNHATTQLCLRILTQLSVRHAPHYNRHKKPIRHILDMGTGTGILAMAAAKLFKNAHIDAIDIAPEAVAITSENIAVNHLLPQQFHIRQHHRPDIFPEQKYQLVIANILAEPLSQMRLSFAKIIDANGFLILSGLLDMQVNFLHHAMQHHFILRQKYQQGDWMALLYQRKSS